MSQLLQGLADVEHGGELDHHPLCFLEHQVLKFHHVGSAVGDTYHLPSMAVATGGVDEDAVDGIARL